MVMLVLQQKPLLFGLLSTLTLIGHVVTTLVTPAAAEHSVAMAIKMRSDERMMSPRQYGSS